MTDIVTTLKDLAVRESEDGYWDARDTLEWQAAEEITRLREELVNAVAEANAWREIARSFEAKLQQTVDNTIKTLEFVNDTMAGKFTQPHSWERPVVRGEIVTCPGVE